MLTVTPRVALDRHLVAAFDLNLIFSDSTGVIFRKSRKKLFLNRSLQNTHVSIDLLLIFYDAVLNQCWHCLSFLGLADSKFVCWLLNVPATG